MKKLISFLMVCGIAVFAAPKEVVMTVNTDTNGVGSVTQAELTGDIDTINISVVGGTTTGTVAVAYAPRYMSSVNLATNVIVGSKTFRPRVDATDVAGVALTGDAPVCYSLVRDDVTVSVTNAAASAVWHAVLILK